jgi:hypothetical protein
VVVALFAVLFVACNKPDASDVTSPSARALIGTATGNVAYRPPDAPPETVANPEGWDVRLENARFSELENGDESIQVVLQVQSQRGPGFEVWLTDAEGTALRWTAGSAEEYDGVVCFQLRLESDEEVLELADGPHELTVAFRDPAIGSPVVAQSIRVAGTPPQLDGATPGEASEVARDLLGCPRSVI